ncbi:hypothetical protein CRG98_003654 [Punica granatum]|uniref:Uncharacterized protein n=1 Tax=Punica granatum TaxID=22663 RepID=A0A2I0L5H9_PUNGR|nr:hypothetical protein CRG98_003654 [Punica granatum]
MRHERGGSANMRCRKVNSHGLADPAGLQVARVRSLGELAVQESKLARASRPGRVASGTSETQQGCRRHEGGGSEDLWCREVNSHGLADPASLQEARTRKVISHGIADPARLQEARARWLFNLAVQESFDGHERGGLANLRWWKVNSHELADLASFHGARARCLGELAVQEGKLTRINRPGKVARGTSEVARRTWGAIGQERGGSANLRCKKVSSHRLADRARFQEARARWLGELAVQESYLARISKPGKVPRGTSEVARRTCGATRQGCKRHERGGSANMRCMKVRSNGLADPARLQEDRARWLGELAVYESKLARVRRPRKTQRGSKRHGRGGSPNLLCWKVISHGLADPIGFQEARTRWFLNLRCRKVNSHGLVDPARLQEARARLPGELAAQEIKLASASLASKVARGTREVARRTCGARK